MLKSYFKMAWRNLLKHKTSAIINIGGLAVGLTTSILVLLFVIDEFGFDRFHRNVADLYLLMKNQQQADGVSTGRSSAGPMAGALRTTLPEVVNAVRVAGTGTVARLGDKQVPIDGVYADTGFFSMMSFPAMVGDPALALQDPGAIILTGTTARQLFGAGTAMGKTLIVDVENRCRCSRFQP